MRKASHILPNEINITWHIDDIKSRDHEDVLSTNDCRLILDSLQRSHDATIGINWDVIDTYIEAFLNDK